MFFLRGHALRVKACTGISTLPQKFSKPTIETCHSDGGRFFWIYAQLPHRKNSEIADLPNSPYPSRIRKLLRNKLVRQNTMPELGHRRNIGLNIARTDRPDELYRRLVVRHWRGNEHGDLGLADMPPPSARARSLLVKRQPPQLTVSRTIRGHVCVGLAYRAGQLNPALAALRHALFLLDAMMRHLDVNARCGIECAVATAGSPLLFQERFVFANYVRRFVSYYWDRVLPDGSHPRDIVLGRGLALFNFGRLRSHSAGLRVLRQAPLLRRKSLLQNRIMPTEQLPLTNLQQADVYVERAAAFLESARFDQAEAAARWALELWPRCSAAYTSLANISTARGDIAAAITHQQQAVEISPDPKTWFALANLAQRANKLDMAATALHEADRLEAGIEPVQTLLADVLMRQGKHNDAIPILRVLSGRPAADARSHLLLGQALFITGKLAEAECFLRTAATMEPSTDTAHSLLAETLYRLGRRGEALVILRERIDQQTSDAHIHYLFGHIAAQDGSLIEAEGALSKAVWLRPAVDGYKGRLAEVIHQQGRRDEALTILQGLVSAGTADARIHYLLGNIMSLAGNFAEAEQALRHAIELQPDVDGYKASLADVLNQRGQRAEAASLLQGVTEKTSRDPNVHAGLGNLLAQGGDFIGAEAAFRSAIKLDPHADNFHASLADVLRRQGKRDDALTILRGLSDNRSNYPHAYASLGNALSEDGDLAGAAAAFRTACELAPDVEAFRFSLADIYERQGDCEKVRVILQDLVKKATRAPQIHARLGALAASMGDLDEAERAFRTATELDPSVAEFSSSRSELLLQLGRREEALTVLREAVARLPADLALAARLAALEGVATDPSAEQHVGSAAAHPDLDNSHRNDVARRPSYDEPGTLAPNPEPITPKQVASKHDETLANCADTHHEPVEEPPVKFPQSQWMLLRRALENVVGLQR